MVMNIINDNISDICIETINLPYICKKFLIYATAQHFGFVEEYYVGKNRLSSNLSMFKTTLLF